MQIVYVDIDKIKPYDNNVKNHPKEQIKQIMESIKESGNNDPIAVDENYVIIEGHGRYEALKKLKYKEVECIILNGLTEEQKNAYRLVHNKLTMNSDFDLAGLEMELNKITDIDLFGGSGSTLIGCEQLNRNCYMMELDPKYVDVIIERWENFTGKKAVKLN